MVASMNPAPRRATYDDLLQVPDLLVAEIIDGELITSPRPASPHARATYIIWGELDSFDRPSGGPGGPGGWWIVPEPGIELPDAPEVSPDVGGWRRERMPEPPPPGEPLTIDYLALDALGAGRGSPCLCAGTAVHGTA